MVLATLAFALAALPEKSSAVEWQLPASDVGTISSIVRAGFPDIAVAPDGTAVVVWLDEKAGSEVVQASVRAAGSQSFSDPITLSRAGAGASARSAEVSSGPDGSFAVGWQEDPGDDKGASVQVAVRPARAKSFGSPQRISTPGYHAFSPQLAIGPDGTVTAVWTEHGVSANSDNFAKVATRRPGRKGFTSPSVLSGERPSQSARVAAGADGTTVAMWEKKPGMWGAALRAPGSGGFAPSVTLNERRVGQLCIGVTPEGVVTVAWRDISLPATAVKYATLDGPGARFSPTGEVSAPVGGSGPSLSVGPDGGTAIAWVNNQAANLVNNGTVQASFRPVGSSRFGEPVTISPSGAFTVLPPAVALGAGLQATAVWGESTNPTLMTQGRLRTSTKPGAESPFGSSITLSPRVLRAEVGVAADGSPTALWVSSGDPLANGVIQVATAWVSDPPPLPVAPIAAASITRSSIRLVSNVTVTRAGRISQTISAKAARVSCSSSKTVSTIGTYPLRCNLGSRQRSYLRRKALKLQVTTRFVPRDGSPVIRKAAVTVDRAK